jgi:hypothetical protein
MLLPMLGGLTLKRHIRFSKRRDAGTTVASVSRDRGDAAEIIENMLDQWGQMCISNEEAEDMIINLVRKARGQEPLPEKDYGGT